MFPHEIENGEITQECLELRKRLFEDPVPHRHKFGAETKKLAGGGNANIPSFSVFYHLDTGEERRYSYFQCRLFYIRWYEHFCVGNPQYTELTALLDGGTNIEIAGYDGFDVAMDMASLSAAYRDTARPFGHELVLACILTGICPWEEDTALPIYEGMFPEHLRALA